jgi:hypothetical protein
MSNEVEIWEEFDELPEIPVTQPIPASTPLSEDQQAAFDWLVRFCAHQQAVRKVLLTGIAGTGKTFLLNRVIEAILNSGAVVGMTAPTHKAVRVLRKFSLFPKKILFGTIHSFLGLREHVDDKGYRSFKPDFESGRERKIDYVDILIVDEASMLPDELFEHIEDEQSRRKRLLVIYTGDAMQIPPVRDKEDDRRNLPYRDAIPFVKTKQEQYGIHVLELNTPQRQNAQSPIIQYAHAIRNNINRPIIPFDILPEHAPALQNLPRGEVKEMLKLFLSEEFKQDPDFIKVIAWRNDTVNYFNNWIRNIVNGVPQETVLPQLLPGDLLVMDAPWIREDNIILSNNEEIVVLNAEVADRRLTYRRKKTFGSEKESSGVLEHKVWVTTVRTSEGVSERIEILDREYLPAYEQMLKWIANDATSCYDRDERSRLWKQYYNIPKRFAWVKYNYALTAHKSQGSSYNNTISMEWDIDINRNVEEGNRIRYVAATRSKDQLFIVK